MSCAVLSRILVETLFARLKLCLLSDSICTSNYILRIFYLIMCFLLVVFIEAWYLIHFSFDTESHYTLRVVHISSYPMR